MKLTEYAALHQGKGEGPPKPPNPLVGGIGGSPDSLLCTWRCPTCRDWVSGPISKKCPICHRKDGEGKEAPTKKAGPHWQCGECYTWVVEPPAPRCQECEEDRQALAEGAKSLATTPYHRCKNCYEKTEVPTLWCRVCANRYAREEL